jgi:integrase
MGQFRTAQGHHPQHSPGPAARRRARPFQARLGDVAIVLAFTGLRWEEAVAVPLGNVNLAEQSIYIDRTASESGGRRDIRDDLKTRTAERTVMIPDIAMPAVRRLADLGAPGRERSDGITYGRLINGDRGGYLGYAMWRRYLKLAHGYTAAHPDGIVSYTAHELRHVCASLLIASGASDVQVAHQMGHSKIETTKNIYGHLFAQDRTAILDAMNQAVSRLHVYESADNGKNPAA